MLRTARVVPMSDAPTPASSSEETTTWTRATRRDHLLRALYALGGGVALIGLGGAAVLKVAASGGSTPTPP